MRTSLQAPQARGRRRRRRRGGGAAACSSGGSSGSARRQEADTGTVTVAVVSNPLITGHDPANEVHVRKAEPGDHASSSPPTPKATCGRDRENVSTHSNAFNVVIIGPYEAPLLAKQLRPTCPSSTSPATPPTTLDSCPHHQGAVVQACTRCLYGSPR